MYKRIAFFLSLLTLVSCHSTKSVVRTTKSVPAKPRTHVAGGVRKPLQKPSSNANNGAPARRDTETIESTSRTVVYSDVVNAYVDQFKETAMGNMRQYGIPASIILAQGILESGAGRGDLALSANNHFGIKCHNDWTGDTVRHDDDSDQECFRKYKDPAESYRDHALFLTGRSRYASLFQLPKGDYEAWARGLKNAGYATDPKYPDKLIGYIERYNLHQYDSQVLGVEFVPIKREEDVRKDPVVSTEQGTYEVQKGDTLYSISKRFNLTVEELMTKNGLTGNALSIGQKLRVQ
ncbi:MULTISPECIES: glucosaminidase domain-containing protein [unclassified Flavobacterium]|uniref:glucosaminidase domain-containing protein n=1 Tax=unclassified Flavobacterium TaxID=196869 RepID=UPI001F13DCE0|nr:MULTISPECIES: glucosaminidase domain-containing protein [unclassified Flavobacterium]UMY66948.1 glucosaminidase domain-containing protein [Flavobacterium sp. HJ-32-4]